MWIFDEFVTCVSPIRYGIGEVPVIRGVGLMVVIDGCSGIFVLGDITSFEFWEIVFL